MELTQEYFDQQLANLATQGDLERLASKADLNVLKTEVSEIKTDVMAIQDVMRSVKSTLQEMNQTLTALDKRDKEDSDAFAKTLVKQDERLNMVERDLKNLKLKQA